MEQIKEKLKITNCFLFIGCLVVAVSAIFAAGSELGWFHILQPVAGDSHWHSSWNGFIVGAGCGVFAFLLVTLIRNSQALKDEKKLKKLYIKEHDERTAQIVTLARNTAMQVLLLTGLVAVVISGYFSITVSLTNLACIFTASVLSMLLMVYYSKKF